MEQRWLAVAAMVLIAVTLLGAVAASQISFIPVAQEVSATCTANSFATSESSNGAFICTPVSWTGLTNFPSSCSAGSVVYGVTTTLDCTALPIEGRVTSTVTTNSISLVSITGLSFSGAANSIYDFRAVIFFESSSTLGASRFAVSVPTGSTLEVCVHQPTSAIAIASGCTTSSATVIYSATTSATSDMMCLIEGYVTTSTTAGSIQIEFESSSTSYTQTVEIGSYVLAFRD